MSITDGPEHLKVHGVHILPSNKSGMGYDEGCDTWRNGRKTDMNNQEIEHESVDNYLLKDT